MSNPQVIGVDFGGTSVKLAVVEGKNLLSEVSRIPTQEFRGPDALIEAIVAEVQGIRETHPDVKAIGIGVPGAVDFPTGMTYNLTNVDGWTNIPLCDRIREKQGCLRFWITMPIAWPSRSGNTVQAKAIIMSSA
jgi:glucokinase